MRKDLLALKDLKGRQVLNSLSSPFESEFRRLFEADPHKISKLEQFYGLEHVAIDTNNFDGEVGKIKSAGIKILEERVLPDGRRVCFFEGPQGVRLEFLEWKQ